MNMTVCEIANLVPIQFGEFVSRSRRPLKKLMTRDPRALDLVTPVAQNCMAAAWIFDTRFFCMQFTLQKFNLLCIK